MRSILILSILALVLAGCGGSNSGGDPRPRLDPALTLAGDDFRDGKVTSSSGALAGEPDQTIQFHGATVRFHVTTLAIDVAGYNGQEFTAGGNTYRLLIGKNGPTSEPNGVVSLQGPAGSVTWNTNGPFGSG